MQRKQNILVLCFGRYEYIRYEGRNQTDHVRSPWPLSKTDVEVLRVTPHEIIEDD